MKRTAIKVLTIVLIGALLTSRGGAWAAPAKPEPLFIIEQGGKYGYINASGKVIIKPQFRCAEDFSEGLAQICTGTSEKNRKYGFIDATGKTVMKPIYSFVEDFHEGLAVAMLFEENGVHTLFIDPVGKVVADLGDGIPFGGFSEGLAAFTPHNIFGANADPREAKLGFVDKSGRFVIKPQFQTKTGQFGPSFKQGISPVMRDGKIIYINKKGQQIFQNLRVTAARPFQEGLSLVMADDEVMGYIDTSGHYVITPQFTHADSFSEGLAEVEINGKWGFINKKGALVIPAIYEETTPFSEGLAAVSVAEGKWAFIDAKGKLVIKPQPFQYVEPFHGGLSMVYPLEDDDAYGYIDKQGKYVWKPAK
ncbi:WG containing repeat-containing protein [Paenibacillus sp. UNC496MF]|uniref:WG repeat-containing protein n=1 Tax=Paenibacillus sp. UNC496MF TaxID=1502753 RepID=UPI0008F266CF|nr:WG repeat-containing protein [Paenibacillus sp. UNC496MF]SFI77353.1 WG containing repeat-containing protein [Paenibacillus sp. UNC496MF]